MKTIWRNESGEFPESQRLSIHRISCSHLSLHSFLTPGILQSVASEKTCYMLRMCQPAFGIDGWCPARLDCCSSMFECPGSFLRQSPPTHQNSFMAVKSGIKQGVGGVTFFFFENLCIKSHKTVLVWVLKRDRSNRIYSHPLVSMGIGSRIFPGYQNLCIYILFINLFKPLYKVA